MRTITILLPLPHRILQPNARTRNHLYRAAKVKNARGTARLVASQSMQGEPFAAAVVQATWTFRTNARRDHDNLTAWLKSYIDGCVDAGVLVDDSVLRWKSHEIVVSKSGLGVELKFEEVYA